MVHERLLCSPEPLHLRGRGRGALTECGEADDLEEEAETTEKAKDEEK